MPRAALGLTPLDPARLLAEVTRPANGAEALFVGTVREQNAGRAVTGIVYSAYDAMALGELTRIVERVAAEHGTPDVVCEHRLGALAIGDASVVVAVGHPRRDAAFAACRAVIESLKATVRIFKQEQYVDGTREWVHNGQR